MSKDSSVRYYEKKTKTECGHEQHKNLPEHEKQRLVEYRKRYKVSKNKIASQIKTD